MSKIKEGYLKAILGLLCMIFLIYIGSTLLKGARLDLTEEKLYTLSQGTKNILKKLDSPITLKLYYSKEAANKGTEGLRIFNNYFLYVQTLLEQYAENSRNNIKLKVIDPRPDTEDEEDAVAYGLRKFNLTDTERYFFGLVAENESGSEKIIEFFDPNEKDRLEYELTKLIYSTQNPQKKNIGVISSLEVIGEEVSPYMEQVLRLQGKPSNSTWTSINALKEFYNVQKVEKDTNEILGVDTLIVIHPKDFSKETVYAIDQFLLNGGNLIVFVDPNNISDQSTFGQPSSSPGPEFSKMMKTWGVELEKDTYIGDKYLSGVGQFNPSQPPGRLIALLNCNQKCRTEHNNAISSGINNLTFVLPGSLKLTQKENIESEVLLSTTDKGNTYKAQSYELANARAMWNKFQEGIESKAISYRISGLFESSFDIKPETDKSKNERTSQHIKESTSKSSIVLVPDVDMLNDQFAFKRTFLGMAPANDNVTFLLNTVDALSGDIDLMSVRSKARINRSFDVVDEIEFNAEKKTQDKVKDIQANISRFQTELSQLGRKANEENMAVIRTEGIRKKKELAKKIALLKKELRNVRKEGREEVENLGKTLQVLNTLLIPIIVIVFGLFYSQTRKKRYC